MTGLLHRHGEVVGFRIDLPYGRFVFLPDVLYARAEDVAGCPGVGWECHDRAEFEHAEWRMRNGAGMTSELEDAEVPLLRPDRSEP